MRVLGVDPGITGGLAIVEIIDGAAPALVECIDIPVVGTGAKERVDVAAIRNFIDRHKPIRGALIERAQAMPKQGASSGFKYGRAVGAIEAAIALSGIPVDHRRAVDVETILATTWQGQRKRATKGAAVVSGCSRHAGEASGPQSS